MVTSTTTFNTSTFTMAAQPQLEFTPEVVMHKCDHPGCDRQFNRKYTLAEHAMTHTGEKPHVCPVKTCGKSFSTSGNLSRHKRLHGYIEPLQCPVQGCICTFPSNNKLAKHMKFHYASSDDVKVCLVTGCGKTFSTTGNLNRHMKAMHGCDSDVMSSDAESTTSHCSSPVASSGIFANLAGSPTAADQWAPQQTDTESESESSFGPADSMWSLVPISFTQSEAEDSWDVLDALSVFFEDEDSTAILTSESCDLSLFQSSLQYNCSF